MTYFGNTSGHKNDKAFKTKYIWSIGKCENVWSLLKWEIETFVGWISLPKKGPKLRFIFTKPTQKI